jgi:glycosyltransferase involved in cell wall biosynthesis
LSISVLIPAYRPTYLRQAIASVLTQGFEDFELIIGDDNPGDQVEQVVGEFRDRRIRHLRTAGSSGAIENMRVLWNAASRPLLKYLFDDDLLMPSCLGEMLAAIEAHPASSFCFCNRYIIDEAGLIREERERTPAGRIAPVSHGQLGPALLAHVSNFIGEFSNVLIDRRSGVAFSDIDEFEGFEVAMLGDVGFFLNATKRAPAVQLGRTLTAFRRHSEQNSSPAYNPRFARSLCEWELMTRCEYAAGRLTEEQALAAARKLEGAYRSWAPRLPELDHIRPNLAAFAEALTHGPTDALDEAFRRGWSRLCDAVEEKWRARRPPAAQLDGVGS